MRLVLSVLYTGQDQSVCQGLGWQKCQSFHIFAVIVHFWYKTSQHLLYLCSLERKLISFQFSPGLVCQVGCGCGCSAVAAPQPALLSPLPARTGALIALWAPGHFLLHRGERREERTWPSSYAALHSAQTAGEIKLPDIISWSITTPHTGVHRRESRGVKEK